MNNSITLAFAIAHIGVFVLSVLGVYAWSKHNTEKLLKKIRSRGRTVVLDMETSNVSYMISGGGILTPTIYGFADLEGGLNEILSRHE